MKDREGTLDPTLEDLQQLRRRFAALKEHL